MDVTELLQKVKPFVLGWFETAGGGAGPFAPSPHELNGAHHSGTLATAQYPDALLRDGSRSLTGNLSVGAGITIDGVDISAHVVDANAHHAQQHTLVGTDHTATGLTVGHVVRASGATTFAWAQLQHSDLGGVSADQHHAGFVGLAGDLGSATPDAGDLIMLDGGNGIITAASGNTVMLSVAAGTGLTFSSGLLVLNWSGTPNNVSLAASAAGSSLYAAHVDHRHQLDVGIVPTWTGLHTFNAGIDVVGTIEFQAAGTIKTLAGDLTISSAGDIIFDPAGAQIRIAASHTLQSDHYASQTTGWGITYAGAGDFRYLFADELHAKSFIADLEQALAGGQIISKSVAMISRNFTAPAAGAAATLYVRDLPSAENMAAFQSGDVVRLRTFSRAAGSLTIADCWGVVTSYSDLSNKEQSWTFTRSTGGNAGAMAAGTVIAADSLALDYGTTGNGFYEVNAIDGAYGANSPYAQIVTWTTHPATGKTVRTRLGNLYGITATTEYGLFAGEGVTAGDSYLRLTDKNFELHNLDLAMYDSGNVQRIGMDAGAAAGDKLMWAGVSLTDPKFIVYGNGNVWLSTLAISDRMGAPIFSLADGALLLGPSCAITPTSWTSTRGQTATISGAFHQVDGRWPGTRALVIEPGMTNYAENPRPSSSGSSWPVYGGSFSFVSETGPFIGNTVGQVVSTGSSNLRIGRAIAVTVTAGDAWTVSFWAKSAASKTVYVAWHQSGSPYAVLSNYLYFAVPTTWTKFTGKLTVNTGDTAQLIMGGLTAGDTVQIANVQIEKLAFPTSYCDGDLGVGYSWSGAPHASTSARTTTSLTFSPQGYIDLSNGSLSFWFQTPCDYNTSGLSATRGLFAWWNAWNTESFYISFSATMTQVNVTSYRGSSSQMSMIGNLPTTMKAGDWVHVVVTFTTNDVNLYINGVWKANDTTYTAPAITSTTAYLGSVTAPGCVALGEFAAFARPLTAEEVSTIYALNRPLSDCGSYSTPGVYILDGKFDLRSSTTGARVQVGVDGISGWSSDTTKTFALETDGDFFAGSNLSSPLTTTLAVFSNAQTYGGESLGAGDVLIGCNISMPNLLFDLSASKLSFRGGTTEAMAFYYNGSATFGEVAANKFNLMWDATVGDLLIRQNTTAYFQVDGSASLLKFGSNVSAAATTAIAIFGAGQTYNSEAVGAGDLLIGDNSASKANVLWDKSTGQLKFRGGTTVQVYIDTDGAVVAGGGVVKLNSDGIQTLVTTDFANARAYKFLDGTTNVGGLESYRDTTGIDAHSVRVMAESVTGDYAYAGVRADAPASLYSEAYLWALCGTHSVKMQLQSNEASGSYRFYLSGGDFILDGATKSMRVEGGLYVGGIATAADAGQVWLNGLMRFMAEISDPAAPSSNQAKVYLRDNGSGKTQLCVRFATGAVQVLATEP